MQLLACESYFATRHCAWLSQLDRQLSDVPAATPSISIPSIVQPKMVQSAKFVVALTEEEKKSLQLCKPVSGQVFILRTYDTFCK